MQSFWELWKKQGCLGKLILAAIVLGAAWLCIALIVSAIRGAGEAVGLISTSTPRPTATVTPVPTDTPIPTDTPMPAPTDTPAPTNTPLPTNTPAPTETPAPTSTPLSPDAALLVAIESALGSCNRDVPRISAYELDDKGIILVVWAINDNLSGKMITRGAMMDIVDILQAIDGSGVDYTRADLLGTFSMVDKYGEVDEHIVVNTMYSRETIDLINWEGFLTDNVYVVADEVYRIHPEFEP